MSGIITNILTDSSARSDATVQKALDQQSLGFGAWF